jgi:hypothetical protein
MVQGQIPLATAVLPSEQNQPSQSNQLRQNHLY